jgi:hypothetical protein
LFAAQERLEILDLSWTRVEPQIQVNHFRILQKMGESIQSRTA